MSDRNARLRVLVCDADEDTQNIVSALLEARNCDVTVTEDIDDAVRLARSLLPDVVLTETILPRGDGVHLIQRLQGSPVTAWIPVGVCTSRPFDEHRRQCLEAGARVFLPKPIPPLELLAHVQALAAGGKREGDLAGGGGGPEVLLIDDDRALCEMLRDRMEGLGYRVHLGRDGEEAVRLAAERRPDVIFMNLVMPRLDGWNAGRILRRNRRTADIPIVLMSGYCSSGEAGAVRAAGFRGLLPKPFRVKEMLRLVEEIAPVPQVSAPPGSRRLHDRQGRRGEEGGGGGAGEGRGGPDGRVAGRAGLAAGDPTEPPATR